jgi:hypothetical protein
MTWGGVSEAEVQNGFDRLMNRSKTAFLGVPEKVSNTSTLQSCQIKVPGTNPLIH